MGESETKRESSQTQSDSNHRFTLVCPEWFICGFIIERWDADVGQQIQESDHQGM